MNMDLSELQTRKEAAYPTRPFAAEPLHAHALLAQLGSEVARSLSSALERVTALSVTGRIDRSGLRCLRDEVDRARRAGIMGQQVSRFASGRMSVSRERLDLTALLQEALHQRAHEAQVRGIELRRLLAPAEVMGDATLVFSLLQSLLDWGFEHAVSRLELQLDVKSWPIHARLVCGFAHHHAEPANAADAAVFADSEAGLGTMSWCLLQQTAVTLGLSVMRKDTAGRTTLMLEFPDTLPRPIEGMSAVELDDPTQTGHNSQPLAGHHVLVLAGRREVRQAVREALQPMGLMIDFVTSVDEAAAFCRDGPPHALVYEATLAGERFEKLRAELLVSVPALAFVQITEHSKAFEILSLGGRRLASVGREALMQMLPAAMMFELSRSG
ncbi:MAG: hypothetical protein H7Z19_11295 [Chitinophagaceae bacterium]|nr:hypothetical protein [Rubrivivax sp.]